jgi:AraC-like DNA-binding protein
MSADRVIYGNNGLFYYLGPMCALKKKDGFKGQRAIVIPPTILSRHCETHSIVKQLYVTDIGYFPNALYHYRLRKHGINQHILIYCVKGTGWARISDKNYTVSPGEFIMLPANIPHEYGASEITPWTIYWMHFKGTSSFDFINMMLNRMGDHVAPISFQENRQHLFEEIYTSVERGYSIDNICYASLSLQYFLGSCCFDNNYNYLSTHDKKDSITVCVNYLQKHIDKTLSLQDVADAVNLSVSHFASVFKKSTGFSVIEYFNHLKTQKACQYLQFTDLRINEIAGSLGIEDPYYFSRMFTKVIGISPNKYRSRKKI